MNNTKPVPHVVIPNANDNSKLLKDYNILLGHYKKVTKELDDTKLLLRKVRELILI